ncbi:ABC transporter permease [Cellulosimicrobium terreum]|nr:ABC transporter permease [Cellulosimicrobium terreum]
MTSTAATQDRAATRVSFRGLLASESLKARGLRSSWWLLSVAVLLPIVIALATALTDADTGDGATSSALAAVTGTNYLPHLLLVLLGTLVATTEYERGAVEVTFAVVPRRVPVVLAKVVLVAVVALVASLVSSVLGYLTAAAVLGGDSLSGLGDPGVLRVIVGTAYFQAASAVIAVAVGLMIRSSIGAVAATLGFLYAVPALLQAIPVAAVTEFARTFPGPESSILELPGTSGDGSDLAWSVVWVLAWTVVVVVLGCVVVRRRDV